jgi:outer membrane protein assembly factor BamD (BamD/ComL family)
MKKQLLFWFAATVLITSCSSDAEKDAENNQPKPEKNEQADQPQAEDVNSGAAAETDPAVVALLNEIQVAEGAIAEPGKGLNKAKADQYIALLASFASKFPEHRRSPEMLYKAASMSSAISEQMAKNGKNDEGYARKSVALNKRLLENYPNSDFRELAYRQLTAVLDFDLEDDDEAIKYYTAFKEEFGANEAVRKLCEARIKYPKITPEDIISGRLPADYPRQ